MEIKEQLKKALEELREDKERKFDQTVDLIINLQKFNPKKDSVNTIITLPHKVKDKKIAGFLEVKSPKVDSITQEEFKKYENKKALKKLVDTYGFFISQASLMPKVATTFGRVLGPAGKMPSPQMGILTNVDDKTLDELKERINKSIKIKTKETSIKFAIGKQSMKDEEIIENIMTAYNSIIKALPKQKENIRNLKIKFTMTKPIKISVK